ncbi:MAG: hypothetical protein Ta2A_11950 [Treponemataceae bacterium]|nr:MAG: hypothetical protein Ta2A_11950 [Treponemataceae bacterium]
MEIMDKPKSVEKLTQKDEEKYFDAIISGKDITEKLETSRGTFTVKFMTLSDFVEKGRLFSLRSNYAPMSSLDTETINVIEATSFLDVAIVDYPEWFKEAKENNPNFSFGDIPDDALIFDLYKRGRSFRESMLGKFTKKSKSKNTRQTDASATQETVGGGGVFEGLSG